MEVSGSLISGGLGRPQEAYILGEARKSCPGPR